MTDTERRRLQVLAMIAETMGRDPDDLAACDCNLCRDARMRYGRLADRIEALYAAEMQPPNSITIHRILGEIRAQLEAESIDLAPEEREILNANLWDLYDDDKPEGPTS